MKKKIFSVMGMLLLATACQPSNSTNNGQSQDMDASRPMPGQNKNRLERSGRSNTRDQMQNSKPVKRTGSCGSSCDTGCNSCGPCCENTEASLDSAQLVEEQESQI